MSSKSRILIVDNGSTYTSKIVKLCEPYACEIIESSQLNVTKAETYRAVILSGGHTHEVMGGEKFYANEIDLIRRGEVPILGICLGFQLIAHTFGLPVHVMPELEHGILEIEPTRYGRILLWDGSFKVFEFHRWVVAASPKDFRCLAISKDGIEAIQHRQLPIAGFQFHPEMFVDRTQGHIIFDLMLTRFLKDSQLQT